LLGFATPWKFAAKNRLPKPDSIPAQSTVDAQQTEAAICKDLLTSRDLPAIPGGHQLTLAWAQQILDAMPATSKDIVYLDAAATASVDLGDPRIKCSILYDRRRDQMLIGYYNGTDYERDLPNNARAKLRALVGRDPFSYVYDAISGESQWSEIDVPAHGGRWEVLTPRGEEYGPRLGIGPAGTYMSNMMAAVAARKAEMEK
jgi:hypothetical protein